MRIGITFDLRDEYLAAGYGEEETAEFDRPETIEALAAALRGLGHQPDKIGNVRQLVKRLAAGDQWDLVFNLCEGLHGIGREAQVPALLDAYAMAYTFSDPVVMSVCMHKGISKALVARAGLPTPRSIEVTTLADLDAAGVDFPVFVKPIAEGTGKGVTPRSCVESEEALREQCATILARYRQPALVEAFLSGREFTVGLLGTGADARVLGTLEIVLLPGAEEKVYSYVNKENCEKLVEYRLVRPQDDTEVARAEQIALAAWRALGCRDAGRIDLRSDGAGRPQFLEANPLAGLHPTHSDLPILATQLGMPYQDLIGAIVASARLRRN